MNQASELRGKNQRQESLPRPGGLVLNTQPPGHKSDMQTSEIPSQGHSGLSLFLSVQIFQMYFYICKHF